MAKINIEKMGLKELTDLERELREAIVIKQGEERAALKAQIRQMVEASGLSIEDVLGTAKPARKGNTNAVAVKYRNPDNPDETWSGRGRMAKWLAEKIKKRGATLADFAV